MIKPASSLCNMKCDYCFYNDISDIRSTRSFGIMSRETAEKIIKNIFCCTENGDRITFIFQGGEPTLAGLDFFRFFAEKAEEYRESGVHMSFCLQTNGCMIDEKWCYFLKEHNFLVGLSLDCDPDIHNLYRRDFSGKGTFSRVTEAKKLFERFKVEFNILSVLSNPLARHPGAVWNFILSGNIKYVQFIPCLAPLCGGKSGFALSSERYASFYSALFKLWLEEYKKDNYISVKLFDDIINLLAFSRSGACGLTGNCSSQIVVEADGSVYPCDFYALDRYQTGNLSEETLSKVYYSKTAQDFLNRENVLPSLCKECRYKAICGGGCERMRSQIFCSEGDKNCGQKLFLDKCIEPMLDIAQRMRRI